VDIFSVLGGNVVGLIDMKMVKVVLNLQKRLFEPLISPMREIGMQPLSPITPQTFLFPPLLTPHCS